MELHRGYRQRLVLDAHHYRLCAAVWCSKACSLHQALRQWPQRIQGVVPRHAEGVGQAPKDGPEAGIRVLHAHLRGLPVHRVRELAQLASEVLHQPLEAEAHPEDGQPAVQEPLDVRGELEVARPPRSWREHDEVQRLHVLQGALRLAVPDRRHLGPRLAQVVRERVHEGVLEVDEEHPQPRANERSRGGSVRDGRRHWCGRGRRHCIEASGGLQLCLLLFGVGHAVIEQRGACADLCNASMDPHSPQCEPGVQVPVEGNVPNGCTIPAALGALRLLHEPHGPRLGCPADRDCPRVAKEGIDGIKLRTEVALNMIHCVDKTTVHLDLSPADDLHSSVFTDPRLVIPVHVGAHGDLRLLLRICQNGANVLRVFQGVLAPSDGATDRACFHANALQVLLGPHEHLRRGAHEELILAQVDEEAVGGRVALLQPMKDLARRRFAWLAECLG
mmetsp:Transcript_69071/g.202212  ORF Transcript_69071/g.202212 Transcript_69071/m.202212 type:complete len:447 (-) Transcript_69071:950-2290(-)